MFRIGDRVIFEHPLPALDGLRGAVEAVESGGVYQVRFDNGSLREVWESKLALEADDPGYPLPGAQE